MDKIVLDCAKCGGQLTVTAEPAVPGGQDLFRCAYCDAVYLVKREEGTVRIVRLEERVDRLGDALGAVTELQDLKAEERDPTRRFKHPIEVLPYTLAGALIGGLFLAFSLGVGWRLGVTAAAVLTAAILAAGAGTYWQEKARYERLRARRLQLQARVDAASRSDGAAAKPAVASRPEAARRAASTPRHPGPR
jgi:hypothetical protein